MSRLQTPKLVEYQFELKNPIPVYLVAMAVGDIASKQVSPRISVYTEPSLLEDAYKEFSGVLEKFVDKAEELFGFYQWDRYDILIMPPCFPWFVRQNQPEKEENKKETNMKNKSQRN